MTEFVDPIDGLIRYVQEIKPYHSKIIEVLTEYVYTESINVTMTDTLRTDIGIVVSGANVADASADTFTGTFGVGPYDASPNWPVISVNITLLDGAFDPISPGYDSTNKTVAIPDDQTSIYRIGRNVVVELSKFNTVTGNTSQLSSNEYSITGSTFETNKQTNGIANNPLTRLVLSGLDIESNYTLQPNEQYVANVKLTPTDIHSVVTGYGSGTMRIHYTSIDPSPSPSPNPVHNAAENIADANYANSVIFNGDVRNSYPFSASITLLLASGKKIRLTTVTNFYDAANDRTIVRALENIPAGEDYTGAQVIENFRGFSEEYPRPKELIDPEEGLTQAQISESLVIGWFDANGEVLDGAQFQIREITGGDTILVTGDASDRIEAGDTIQILASPDSANNGTHTVTLVTASGQGTEIEVSSTLTNSSTSTDHRGWVETT